MIFRCRRCGTCCLGRGGVRLDGPGLQAAARVLGLPENEFLDTHTRGAGPPWELALKTDGYCSLHREGDCLIEAAKPRICRDWPYLPALLEHENAFLDAKCACPGLPPTWSWEDFQAAAGIRN